MDIPKKFSITLVCLFCGEPLHSEKGISYASGDMMKCSACGEGNDYDSVIEVAKEKGIKQAKEAVQQALKKRLGGLFK